MLSCPKALRSSGDIRRRKLSGNTWRLIWRGQDAWSDQDECRRDGGCEPLVFVTLHADLEIVALVAAQIAGEALPLAIMVFQRLIEVELNLSAERGHHVRTDCVVHRL